MNDMAMNQLWATQQTKLEEKDAEIERLSARCAFMASNDYVHSLTSEIERLQGEIRKLETLWFSEHYRMRELLGRAASSLVVWASKDSFAAQDLIAELRKAAAE